MRDSKKETEVSKKKRRALELAEERMELLDMLRLIARDEIEHWTEERKKEKRKKKREKKREQKLRKGHRSRSCSLCSFWERLFHLDK
ncbi:hypothetical protein [Porphyromonas circumdentaria]|uniref:hypothetical protein n=1 Tax=Porphyromonas circumdentaria TaxID=29524 RepID=UPI000998F665|nr:hypothetical protein [Porphyromonas circumdentaria]MBB6275384.1 hypothetical protein [Porphyromonas circumdentaria]MDO4722083.1 hypothetical protein [Porphyromonas circumdentaria]